MMTMNLSSYRILSNAPIFRHKATKARSAWPPVAANRPVSSGRPASSSVFFHPRCHHNHTPAEILPSFRSLHCTPLTSAQTTINVPTMGDSITEGTIVEWCVPPGSRVREGDVLALVETDKVTVDIKADRDGILVKQLGEVEGVVEVGQGLYILETDVSGSVSAPAESMGNVADVSAVNASLDAEKMVADTPLSPSLSVPSSLSPSSMGGRVPSIHFLGKEGWRERRSGVSHDAAPAPTTKTIASVNNNNNPKSPTSVTYFPYSAMYGRPPITDDEMEALILGGAEEAPEVKSSDKGGWRGVTFVGGKVITAGPRGVWLAE